MDSHSWCHVAPLHLIVDVPGITVDYDILGLGYPSSEGRPIGSSTVPRPCARDSADASAEGEEGDRKTVDENRAEDNERDNRLDGLRQEFGLGLWLAFGHRQLMNGKGGDEYGA